MNPQENKFNPFAPKDDKDKQDNKLGFLTPQPSTNQMSFNMPNSASPFGEQKQNNIFGQSTMFGNSAVTGLPQNNNAQSNLFSQPNTNNSFGQNNQVAGTQTGNLFGHGGMFGQSTNAQSNTQPIFGQTQPNPLGQNTTQQANAQPSYGQTNSFGQNNAMQTNTPGQSTTPLSNTQPLFGQTQTNTQPLFGQTQTNTQPLFGQTQTSALGQTNTQPLFGTTSSFGQQSSLFGNLGAEKQGASAPLGGQNTSFTGQSNPPFGSQQNDSINKFGQGSGTFTSQNTTFGSQAPTAPFGTQQSTTFTTPTSNTPFGTQQSSVTPFGTSQPSAPIFGTQQTSNLSFGGQQINNPSSATQPGVGLFGQQQTSNSSFGTQQNTLFDAPKTEASIFGSQQNNTPAFGAQQSSTTPAFGQQNTGSLFDAKNNSQPLTTSFGSQQANTSLFNAQPPIENNQSQQSNPQPFMFGSAQTTSLGNSSNVQQHSTSLFGNAKQPEPLFASDVKTTFASTQTPSTNTQSNNTQLFGNNQQNTSLNSNDPGREFDNKMNTTQPSVSGLAPPTQPPSFTSFTHNSTTFSATEDIQKNSTVVKNPESGLFKSDIPLDFRNSSVQEIIHDLQKKLKDNISLFETSAKKVFEVDEEMKRSRNIYCTVLKKLDEQETNLKDFNDNIDYFFKYIEDFKQKDKKQGDGSLLALNKEVEKLADDYNSMVTSFEDSENSVLCLINESMSIIKWIESKLDEIEKYK